MTEQVPEYNDEPQRNKRGGVKVVAGLAIAGAIFGLVKSGADDFIKDKLGLDSNLNSGVASATVTKTIPIDKACYLRYETNIKNSSTEWKVSRKIGPVSVKLVDYKTTFSGDIRGDICNDQTDQEITYHKDTGKVDVTMDASKFYVETSRKNPMDPDAFHDNPGALVTLASVGPAVVKAIGAENAVKKLPHGEQLLEGPEHMRNAMNGWAEAGAYTAAGHDCGPVVWNEHNDVYAKQIAKSIAHTGSAFTAGPIEASDVNVTFKNIPTFDTQYDAQIDQVRSKLGTAGVTVNTSQPTVCTLDKEGR